MAVLSGIVVSGQGNFSSWIEKLQEHYRRKTGMRLFPGTLNILLDYPYSLPPDVIRLEKEEYGGTVSVSLVPCRIFDRRAFLIRTDANEAGRGHLAPSRTCALASSGRYVAAGSSSFYLSGFHQLHHSN